jgi:cell pole-organizing protein PopZ
MTCPDCDSMARLVERQAERLATVDAQCAAYTEVQKVTGTALMEVTFQRDSKADAEARHVETILTLQAQLAEVTKQRDELNSLLAEYEHAYRTDNRPSSRAQARAKKLVDAALARVKGQP